MFATATARADKSLKDKMALIAVGGYGRGALAPGSDIDLLFLIAPETEADKRSAERATEFILYLLWDLGLKVGHAMRTVPDCIELAREDITIRTALLDMRRICGDQGLADDLKRAFATSVVKDTQAEFVAAKLQEREERHEKAGASRYLVEPNVKDGKGGLRDLHTLFWLAKYVYGAEDRRDLIRVGLLSDEEWRRLERAFVFLWSVRVHAHVMTGRAEDKLSFDLQPGLARRLGYASRGRTPAVERFMKHYFVVAKDVGDLTRIFCAVLEEDLGAAAATLTTQRRRGDNAPEDPSDPAFRLVGGRIDFADDGASLRRDPSLALRLFQIADAHDFDIHPNALRAVNRSLALMNGGFRRSAKANGLFLKILETARDPERVVRRLSESGVLARFLPDFGRITGAVRYTSYHHYPVDEHCIRAVGVLAQIERGELAEDHPVSTRLVSDRTERAATYLAVLLHEIGLGRPIIGRGEARIAGGRIAARIARRLGLDRQTADAVGAAVRDYAVLAETAQKRDLTDPKTVSDFANFVGGQDHLDRTLITNRNNQH
ncbi:MAG: [protein-PII] uridylyltransferase, partial [Pseudomonadota bacterium]